MCSVSLLPEEEMKEKEDYKGWKTRLVPRVVLSVLTHKDQFKLHYFSLLIPRLRLKWVTEF